MVEINVCIGSSCHLKGAYNVIQTFQQMVEASALHDKVEMKARFCMNRCRQGVAVSIGEEIYSVSPETAMDFFQHTVVPLTK